MIESKSMAMDVTWGIFFLPATKIFLAQKTCTMGGYRAIIIKKIEWKFKIKMIFGGICDCDQIFGYREDENLEHQILATTEMR